MVICCMITPLNAGPQVVDPRVAYLISDILDDDAARVAGYGQ